MGLVAAPQSPSPPARRAQPAWRRRRSGLGRPGRSRTESGRRGEAGGEEGGAGAGGEGRGGARRAGNARGAGPQPPGGCVRAMALRLVSDFDLRKDVLPWLRSQRAASAAAGARGGGPGAGGARPGGGQVGAGEGVESESFLARGLPSRAEVGGIDPRRGRLRPLPTCEGWHGRGELTLLGVQASPPSPPAAG